MRRSQNPALDLPLIRPSLRRRLRDRRSRADALSWLGAYRPRRAHQAVQTGNRNPPLDVHGLLSTLQTPTVGRLVLTFFLATLGFAGFEGTLALLNKELGYNEQSNYYEIVSRDFPQIKQQLLTGLTNHGRPFIYVVDGNYRNRGELFLKHKYQGVELKLDYARDTLANLQRLWMRPVHVETIVDDKPTVISFDGSQHEMKQK